MKEEEVAARYKIVGNTTYLFDFCPPGFHFEKKVAQILYSDDQKDWHEKYALMDPEDGKGIYQRFVFYDGTLSLIYPTKRGGF